MQVTGLVGGGYFVSSLCGFFIPKKSQYFHTPMKTRIVWLLELNFSRNNNKKKGFRILVVRKRGVRTIIILLFQRDSINIGEQERLLVLL